MIMDNFSWSDSIYLKKDSQEFDLHNDYDFRKFSYDIREKLITLEWQRGTGDWVNLSLPHFISLRVSDVYHLEVKPRDPKMPFSEDDCLNSFGYLSNEHWCDGQLWTDKEPDENWKWSFEFQSGAEIIVGAKSATACIKV